MIPARQETHQRTTRATRSPRVAPAPVRALVGLLVWPGGPFLATLLAGWWAA